MRPPRALFQPEVQPVSSVGQADESPRSEATSSMPSPQVVGLTDIEAYEHNAKRFEELGSEAAILVSRHISTPLIPLNALNDLYCEFSPLCSGKNWKAHHAAGKLFRAFAIGSRLDETQVTFEEACRVVSAVEKEFAETCRNAEAFGLIPGWEAGVVGGTPKNRCISGFSYRTATSHQTEVK